jgi:hypothetical protein
MLVKMMDTDHHHHLAPKQRLQLLQARLLKIKFVNLQAYKIKAYQM